MNKAKNFKSNLVEDILNDISQEEYEKAEKKMLLAARIDDAIKAKGLKKKDFARLMQKSPSEITKWISGTHNFTCETLIDIENVLGIELIVFEKKPSAKSKTFNYQASSPASTDPSGYGSFSPFDNSIKHSYSFSN